jgi:uncharacterized protein (TIGR01244 family)
MKQHKLADDMFVLASTPKPGDMAHLAAHGVKMVVNNLPEGETPGQPSSAEFEAACRAAGLAYRHIPWDQSFGDPNVSDTVSALDEAGGRVAAFCVTGTRSTWLWALARARMGDDVEQLRHDVAHAYDIRMIRPFLVRSAQKGLARRG